jgi:hypothetical protein
MEPGRGGAPGYGSCRICKTWPSSGCGSLARFFWLGALAPARFARVADGTELLTIELVKNGEGLRLFCPMRDGGAPAFVERSRFAADQLHRDRPAKRCMGCFISGRKRAVPITGNAQNGTGLPWWAYRDSVSSAADGEGDSQYAKEQRIRRRFGYHRIVQVKIPIEIRPGERGSSASFHLLEIISLAVGRDDHGSKN